MRPRARRKRGRARSAKGLRADPRTAELVIEQADASLLDLVDSLLNRGVLLSGSVILGVADVDLVYLRLSALLCAVDRLVEGRKRPGRRARSGAW